MTITEMFLPEFDQEMANTRRVLERMPAGAFAWAPHEKSMLLGRLASHVATLPDWAKMTLSVSTLDIAGAMPDQYASAEDLVAAFDSAVGEARAEMAKATDETWGEPWTLTAGEHVLFTLPRVAVYRTWVMNHIIHHRAQLTVYLRLNEVAVPAIYGPSADEQ